jgi:hypothetical protein
MSKWDDWMKAVKTRPTFKSDRIYGELKDYSSLEVIQTTPVSSHSIIINKAESQALLNFLKEILE